MDLISRDKALMCATGCFPVDSERADECKTIAKRLSDCPSAFEGMTNGEAIEALFPNASIYKHGSTYSVNNEYNFNSTWWNAPWSGGKAE